MNSKCLFASLVITVILSANALADVSALPAWVNKRTSERARTNASEEIQETTYGGARSFEITHNDEFNNRHEHVLFSEDGTRICEFGGQVEQVTSGQCEIEKIIPVGSLL